MAPPPSGHFCANPACGQRLDDAKRAKRPATRFCSRRCAGEYRRAHPAEYRAQREATAEANRRRWREWKAQGIDPAHGGTAAEKRASAVAQSNRARPRRRKSETAE